MFVYFSRFLLFLYHCLLYSLWFVSIIFLPHLFVLYYFFCFPLYLFRFYSAFIKYFLFSIFIFLSFTSTYYHSFPFLSLFLLFHVSLFLCLVFIRLVMTDVPLLFSSSSSPFLHLSPFSLSPICLSLSFYFYLYKDPLSASLWTPFTLHS